ncbi:MAG: carbon-phosphorus lyase complex subunit PhnI [Clostridiales bacterium]|nr:carbon-phosphorus lyase complex subunit PhnI [Clostridiales bacterium]
MAYVAVKGGQKAIQESIKRIKYERFKNGGILKLKNIESGMRGLIDQVMSEASLYDEELAAIAVKQSEGNPEEVVFLLRAFRSTLPRKHYSRIIESETMEIERRISASFKDIPGGQILGTSYDYTHRLIDFNIAVEEKDSRKIKKWVEKYNKVAVDINYDTKSIRFPKVIDYLREEGIMINYEINNDEPKDVTKESLKFPTKRSERLQILTRGQTGAVAALGYASLRGFGSVHPTVGELRVGLLPIYIDSPIESSKEDDDSYYIGSIRVTEVESIIPTTIKNKDGTREERLEVGYGICYGQNESKAIAMSILDRCLEMKEDSPTHDEEFVLYHIDSVEASGFISHLKLPHYVTFQSKLDSVRKTRKEK